MKHNLTFLKDAVPHIPHIIGLVDKNKFSPTYGSFDRNYWHYKTIDFPTGMAQLGVLSLAYMYAYDFKDANIENPYYKNDRIKELIIAGMRYLPKCSHKDGTADEFYPFERALGATSFSLIACAEAYLILKLDEPDIVEFFRLRGDWLVNNAEPAPIANHLAGAALALSNVYLITKDKKYLNGAKKKIEETMALINTEGWFQEYDGCDVGYLTFTIDFMAKYYQKTGDKSVLDTIAKAVKFCSYFMHPDGSFAGEYGSRNTAHFLPAGFVLIQKDIPLAASMLKKYEEGLENKKHEHMDDEKYFFYNVNNYMQAYLYSNDSKHSSNHTANEHLPTLPCDGPDFSQNFDDAKLFVKKNKDLYIVISIAKGGVMKVFKDKSLIYSFTGFTGRAENGDVLTTQLFSSVYEYYVQQNDRNNIMIKGRFQKAFFKLQTTDKFFMLRSIMLTLGRSWKIGSAIKHLLVKKLITKKKITQKTYEINITFGDGTVTLNAEIDNKESLLPFKELYATTDLALIQVPTSRYYQEVNLNSWERIDVDTVKKGKILYKKVIS